MEAVVAGLQRAPNRHVLAPLVAGAVIGPVASALPGPGGAVTYLSGKDLDALPDAVLVAPPEFTELLTEARKAR